MKHYAKPEEHILNIIVQGSDNKILLIKIVFNKEKRKIVPACTWLFSSCIYNDWYTNRTMLTLRYGNAKSKRKIKKKKINK